ncbi:UMP kinase [Ruminococcaceae bacterium OttesenSCG-928-A11]|nr:UMP kinase [Ruminococcaceae bacterium OttesenSCG-928-A11]
MALKYKRVLLKLSGESFKDTDNIIDHQKFAKVAKIIKRCSDEGAEIAVVIGGGNIWRGAQHGEIERVTADQMGMLATVINSLALGDALSNEKQDFRLMTAFDIKTMGEPYYIKRAIRHLEKGRIVLLAGGTGMPYFSTDTGATLRAAEIKADVILKATKVDGVYDMDPEKNQNAKMYDHISLKDITSGKLRVIDLTAATFAEDNNIKMLVFNISDPENIYRVIMGENIGTIVE